MRFRRSAYPFFLVVLIFTSVGTLFRWFCWLLDKWFMCIIYTYCGHNKILLSLIWLKRGSWFEKLNANLPGGKSLCTRWYFVSMDFYILGFRDYQYAADQNRGKAVPWRRWQWAEDSHNDDDCCCFATQPVRTDSEGRTRSAHSLTALTIFHLLLHQSAPDTRGWPRLSGCLPLFSFISVHIEESVNLAYLCRSTSTFLLQFGV